MHLATPVRYSVSYTQSRRLVCRQLHSAGSLLYMYPSSVRSKASQFTSRYTPSPTNTLLSPKMPNLRACMVTREPLFRISISRSRSCDMPEA
jgi:hypothetical protein